MTSWLDSVKWTLFQSLFVRTETRSPVLLAEPLVDLSIVSDALKCDEAGLVVACAGTPIEASLLALRSGPREVFAYAAHPGQRHLAELHRAAIMEFDADQYARFVGWTETPLEGRRELSRQMQRHLPEDTRAFLANHESWFSAGLIESSRWRRGLRSALHVARESLTPDELEILHGSDACNAPERRKLLDQLMNRRWLRWFVVRSMLRLCPQLLARLLFGSSLCGSAKRLRRIVPQVADSLVSLLRSRTGGGSMFQHILTGMTPAPVQVELLEPERYAAIRQHIDRLTIVPMSLEEGLAEQPDASIDRLFSGMAAAILDGTGRANLTRTAGRCLRTHARMVCLSPIPRDPFHKAQSLGLRSLDQESIELTARESTRLFPLISVRELQDGDREPHLPTTSSLVISTNHDAEPVAT